MNWKKLLWTIFAVGGLLPSVMGESQHGTVTDKEHHVTKPFTSAVSDVYMLSASSADGWIFVEEYNFPQNNGWFEVAPGSYSIMCYDNTSPREGATTVFVDAASVFSATLSGQMYKEGTEPGSLTSWSVTGTSTTTANQSIDPVEKVLPLSTGDRAFRYLINFELAPGGLWKYSSTAMIPNPPQIDWQNAGASYSLPSTLDAGYYTITAARNSDGALSATANVTIVEVKSVSAGGITSTTSSPGDNESIAIDAANTNPSIPAGALAFTATPEPGSDWPEGYPKWYVGSTKVQDGGNTYNFSAQGRSVNKYVVSVKCGNEKSINVYVARCQSIIRVNEPSADSGNPLDYFSPANFTYSVGHATAEVAIFPREAASATPFSSTHANMQVGISSANKTQLIIYGISDGTFHAPDGLSSVTAVDLAIVNVSTAKKGIDLIEQYVKTSPSYVLANYIHYDSLPPYLMTQATCSNCATLATRIASTAGLTVPSAYDVWIGKVGGIRTQFEGDSPGFLGPRL